MTLLQNGAAQRPGRRWMLVVATIAALVLGGAWWTRDRWLGGGADGDVAAADHDDHADDHAGHDHDHEDGHEHAGHDHDHGAEGDHDHNGNEVGGAANTSRLQDAAAGSVRLSRTGLRNIGYEPLTVTTQPFERTETVPAMVVEQPGKTQMHLTAPLTGVVTEIHVVEGQAVERGTLLFEMRLTHEELVTAQQEYLKTAESLDVVNREITRLRELGEGVVAGKRILDQEYERQKLEASLRAAEQALLLHGLSEEQVADILETRQLLRTLSVRAPDEIHGEDVSRPSNHKFHVQRLAASVGQQVEAGAELGVIADHCELYLEGRAFEDDAPRLREAARKGWKITARLLGGGEEAEIEGLTILYLADRVDPDSRALHFYLSLPNDVVLDQTTDDGRQFIEWRFKPGQRMELEVPVERLDEQLVLPAEAVVEDGAETFVYRQNGDQFDRVEVHVEFRDGNSAVVARDDGIEPGDVLAGRGAYQMHLHQKKKAGGGGDPHAGHNH